MNGPPDKFGMPIIRARCHLVPSETSDPALIASDAVANLSIGQPQYVAGPMWYYERLTIPPHRQPNWATWERQEQDPMLKAEAARRSTFLAVSLKLKSLIDAGEVTIFARNGSLVGEWIEVPKTAWSLLQFPFDLTFENWKMGHATGGGLDLWDLRVLDRVGATMKAAAIAYGPGEHASIVQRYSAYRRLKPVAIPGNPVTDRQNNRFDREMASIPSLGPVIPNDDMFRSAKAAIQAQLLHDLRAGDLLGSGIRNSAERVALSSEDWHRGKPDFDDSSLQTHNMRFTEILVRQPPHSGEGAKAPRNLARSRADIGSWWDRRVAEHPSGRWCHSEKEDIAAAKEQFGDVDRETIRALREALKRDDRVVQGRRKKTENLPKKSAAQI